MTTLAVPARRTPWRPIAIGLLLAVVALMVAIAIATYGTAPPTLRAEYAYADPRAAPALELTDQDGDPFRLADLRGRPALVYFGYTHCPDVCPATIGTINRVIAATATPLRVVFVTVDPERDSVASMASYVRYLSAEFTA